MNKQLKIISNYFNYWINFYYNVIFVKKKQYIHTININEENIKTINRKMALIIKNAGATVDEINSVLKKMANIN